MMNEFEIEKLLEGINNKFNELLENLNERYELDKYSNSAKVKEYFGLDKPTFHKLLKEGMPMIRIGSRWKGKIRVVEQWFIRRNEVKFN